jgi:hypothetical protein
MYMPATALRRGILAILIVCLESALLHRWGNGVIGNVDQM